MSPLSDTRERAISSIVKFLREFEPRHVYVPGTLGDAVGTVNVPGRSGFVYVRLLGAPERTVRARNIGVPATADASVWVELEGGPGDRVEYRVVPTDDVDRTYSGDLTVANLIITGGGGTDLAAFKALYDAHAHASGDPTQIDHANLTNVTANQHHAQSHNIASHSDTTATGAELETLTDNSMANALHRHSELSASDGTPDQAVVVDAAGNLVLSKISGRGIKVDTGTPTFGWRDLKGKVTNSKGSTKPSEETYRDGITAFQFSAGDDAGLEFHIPHDYVPGTDIHLHVHWSHNSGSVTGGEIILTYEITYAKGHNRGAFPQSVTGTITGTASSTQYQHIVSEGEISTSGGDTDKIDTDDLEPDGLILCRIEMTTNNMTGATPDPFIHEVDVHYQTMNLGTKQKAPDFYA